MGILKLAPPKRLVLQQEVSVDFTLQNVKTVFETLQLQLVFT